METWLIALLVLAAPAMLGAFITYLFCRIRRVAVEERLHESQRELRDMSERLENAGLRLQAVLDSKARTEQDAKRLPELERQAADLREVNLKLKEQVARQNKEREVSEEMIRRLEQAEERLRETFQALASQALQSNADEFLKRARTHLDNIFHQALIATPANDLPVFILAPKRVIAEVMRFINDHQIIISPIDIFQVNIAGVTTFTT